MQIGDSADGFYVILKGVASVSIQLPIQQQSDGLQEVKRLHEMSTFGELGLIADKGKRSAKVTTKTDCAIMKIPKDIYSSILKENIMHNLEQLWQLLKKVSYLQHWSERDLANIIFKMPKVKY